MAQAVVSSLWHSYEGSTIVECAMTQAELTYGTVMKTTIVECAMV